MSESNGRRRVPVGRAACDARADRARGTRSLGLALAALAAAAASVSAAGPSREAADSFRRGIEAYDRKNWAAAIRLFEEAVRREPQEGGKRVNIYGMRYEEYLPHFFLGMARFEAGDVAAAAAALGESRRQGVCAGTQWADRLDSRLAEIGAAAATSAETAAEPDRVAAARAPPPEEVRAAGGSTDEGRAAPAVAEPLATSRDAPALESEDLGTGNPAAPALPRAEGAAPLGAGTPARAGVDEAALRPAIEAFFAGRYEVARSRLDALPGRVARQDPDLCLIRAAAAYYLSRVDAERSAALRLEATRLVPECRRLAGFRPPAAKFFSPPFVRFVAGTGPPG